MAVGDKSANSYGWSARLNEAVPDGGEVTIPAPGFDHRYTDTRFTDVRVGSLNAVFRSPEKVTATFNSTSHDEPVTITLANGTGAEWPGGDEIYVFCPHLFSASDNQYDIKEQIWDLQQRVVALEEVAGVRKPTPPPAPAVAHAPSKEPPHPANHKKGK